jgi:predicted ATPase
MLNRISINGYKSIQEQTIPLEKINIIIGANGSGKSNLISFFKMLNSLMSGKLQQFIGREGGAQSLLYYGYKKTSLLHASLEFSDDQHNNSYSFSLIRTVEDSFIFSEEIVALDGKQKEFGAGQKESILSQPQNIFDTSTWVLKDVLSSCRFFQFHDTSDTAHIRNGIYIENNRYLYSDGGNLAAYLYMLKNKSDEYRRYYERIVERIQDVMPQFSDFVLEPKELNPSYISLNWREKDNDEYIFGAHQISDGTLRFIELATLLLQPPERLPQIIIIDEPELGLHPHAIDLLGNMIVTASRYVQIIIATQSPRLVDDFEIENIIVAERDIFHKGSVFYKPDKIALVDWLEEYSLSQLWEKNVIGGQP